MSRIDRGISGGFLSGSTVCSHFLAINPEDLHQVIHIEPFTHYFFELGYFVMLMHLPPLTEQRNELYGALVVARTALASSDNLQAQPVTTFRPGADIGLA